MVKDANGIFAMGSAAVGQRVKERREECNITVAQLAETLRIGGMRDAEPWWISRLEDGEVELSVDEFLLIAVALDASPAWLLIPSGIGSVDDTIWLPGAPKEHTWGVATRRRAGAVWQWLAGEGPISWEWAEQTYPPAEIAALVGFAGTEPPTWVPWSTNDTPGWYHDSTADGDHDWD